LSLAEVRLDGHVAVVTLNRAEALNAISGEMANELAGALLQAAANPSTWVIVVGDFCPLLLLFNHSLLSIRFGGTTAIVNIRLFRTHLSSVSPTTSMVAMGLPNTGKYGQDGRIVGDPPWVILPVSCRQISDKFFGMMVARDGVEPPTPAFSGLHNNVFTMTWNARTTP